MLASARGKGQRSGRSGTVGQLYDTIQRIEQVIAKRNMQAFKTKGLIALKAGFSLALVDASTPDDPGKLTSLKSAAKEVLGEPV
jgi:hypothetical protein